MVKFIGLHFSKVNIYLTGNLVEMQILIQWVWEDLRFCTDNKLPREGDAGGSRPISG